jgi:hypothetical protein
MTEIEKTIVDLVEYDIDPFNEKEILSACESSNVDFSSVNKARVFIRHVNFESEETVEKNINEPYQNLEFKDVDFKSKKSFQEKKKIFISRLFKIMRKLYDENKKMEGAVFYIAAIEFWKIHALTKEHREAISKGLKKYWRKRKRIEREEKKIRAEAARRTSKKKRSASHGIRKKKAHRQIRNAGRNAKGKRRNTKNVRRSNNKRTNRKRNSKKSGILSRPKRK